MKRREFLAATAAVAALGPPALALQEAPRGERPPRAEGAAVINPRGRVPLSLLIDDSTTLVNLARFCIPQFAHVFPDRMKQDWRKLPHEIPDAFVRKFGEWCRTHGVKGKYSVIPYPAMVGWVDREIPGWTRQELEASLALLRDFMAKDWDFTPEMVTHTRVINPKTGHPLDPQDESTMENWGWSQKRSVDELAEYLVYALKPLQRAGIPCEGVTSPGGFAGRNLPNYSTAVLQAVRDVYKTEIPYYLKKVHTDQRSTAPEVLCAKGLDGPNPEVVVSVVGATGDWFGGWDGLEIGHVDRFITPDGKGRCAEVIAKGEPCVFVSHWPGFYCNGEETGFRIFQEAVRRLHARYDHLCWMKFTELSRYWSAKELTKTSKTGESVAFQAPFACPDFTVEVDGAVKGPPRLSAGNRITVLEEVKGVRALAGGTWTRTASGWIACFDLPKGASTLGSA
jgi:hypothetical protein